MKLDADGIANLRAQLLDRGAASLRPRAFGDDDPEGIAAYHRVRPLAEAMYLVMAARGPLSEAAKQLIRGTLRALTGGELGTQAAATLVADAEQNLVNQGLEARLDRIGGLLWTHRQDRQLALALVLAASIAVDGTLVAAQQHAFLGLAARLGISEPAALTMFTDAQQGRSKPRVGDAITDASAERGTT